MLVRPSSHAPALVLNHQLPWKPEYIPQPILAHNLGLGLIKMNGHRTEDSRNEMTSADGHPRLSSFQPQLVRHYRVLSTPDELKVMSLETIGSRKLPWERSSDHDPTPLRTITTFTAAQVSVTAASHFSHASCFGIPGPSTLVNGGENLRERRSRG